MVLLCADSEMSEEGEMYQAENLVNNGCIDSIGCVEILLASRGAETTEAALSDPGATRFDVLTLYRKISIQR